MITLYVADDQAIVRQGIINLLSLRPELSVIGEADNGKQATQEIVSLNPDIALLDVQMPIQSGLDVVKNLHEHSVKTRCVLVTTFNDPAYILKAKEYGAAGYILKDLEFDELVNTIHRIHKGDTVINIPVPKRISSEATTSTTDDTLLEPLTTREIEVLQLVATGMDNKEIATALSLSTGTVKNHMSNVLSKMGVRDRTQAILFAIEKGLI